MLSIEQEENIVYMRAKGKLNDEDYDKVLPRLREIIDEHDQIRWYIELEDFEGWTPHAFWRDISFALSNRMNLKKIAVVGENKWHEVMAEVMEVFSANDVERRFSSVVLSLSKCGAERRFSSGAERPAKQNLCYILIT